MSLKSTVGCLLTTALHWSVVHAVPGISPLLKSPHGFKINDEYLLKLDDRGCIGNKAPLTSVISILESHDQDVTQPDKVAKVNQVFDKSCVLSTTLSESELQYVRFNENVDLVVEEQLVGAFRVDWHLDRLDSRWGGMDNKRPYGISGDGTGVNVYVLDSGIDTQHPEFEGRASNFYSVFNDGGVDILGHGTHAAALVGGKNVGVAKNVNIFGVKVLNNRGLGTITQILMGLSHVYNYRSKSRINIITMSLGGEHIQILNSMIRRLFEEDIMIITAAGNNASDACRVSPGKAQETINVGAVGKFDELASFSNYGRCVDMLAPGVGVRSAVPNGGYAIYSGTSVAAPLVAGAAAVFWSMYPEWDVSRIKRNMLLTSMFVSKRRFAVHKRGTTNRLITTNLPCNWCPSKRVTPAMLSDSGHSGIACGLYIASCKNTKIKGLTLNQWFGDCNRGACMARLACHNRAKELHRVCGDSNVPAFAVWTIDGSMVKIFKGRQSTYRFPVAGGRTTGLKWIIYRNMVTTAPSIGLGGWASRGYTLEFCKQLCTLRRPCNAVEWSGSSCWLKRVVSMEQLRHVEARNRPSVHILESQAPKDHQVVDGWRIYYNHDVSQNNFIGVGGNVEEGWNLLRCKTACGRDDRCRGFSWSGDACWLKSVRSRHDIRKNPDVDEQWDFYVRSSKK